MAQVARQFIRHPVDIPIEVRSDDRPAPSTRDVFNLSLGGLALRSALGFEPGVVVDIRISFVRPPFETKARVAWCRSRDEGFELGVEFLNPDDAFRARMVEQVCHIENYKQAVYNTEGRLLTAEEAAIEWIGKYASGFPRLDRENGL